MGIESSGKIGGMDSKVFIFLIAQAGAIVWGAASLTSTVSYQSEQIRELKVAVATGVDDRYRASDAKRDLSRIDTILLSQERRLDAIETKVRP